MNNSVYEKNYLASAILMVAAGLIMMVGGLLLFFADLTAMIAFVPAGILVMGAALVVILNIKVAKKWVVIAAYGVLSVLYLVGLILDIKMQFFGLGFTADLVLFLVYLALSAIYFLKDFKNYTSLWLKACEILLSFAAAACMFFLLFSYASYGYKYSRLDTSESLIIFYLLLVSGAGVILMIANSVYPAEAELTPAKDKKQK